jgi:hypothetical protein
MILSRIHGPTRVDDDRDILRFLYASASADEAN